MSSSSSVPGVRGSIRMNIDVHTKPGSRGGTPPVMHNHNDGAPQVSCQLSNRGSPASSSHKRPPNPTAHSVGNSSNSSRASSVVHKNSGPASSRTSPIPSRTPSRASSSASSSSASSSSASSSSASSSSASSGPDSQVSAFPSAFIRPSRIPVLGRPSLGKRGPNSVSSGSDASSANGSVKSDVDREVTVDRQGRKLRQRTAHFRTLQDPTNKLTGKNTTWRFHRHPTRSYDRFAEPNRGAPRSDASDTASESSVEISSNPGKIFRRDRKMETARLPTELERLPGADNQNCWSNDVLMDVFGVKRGQTAHFHRGTKRHRNANKDRDLTNPLSYADTGF